MYFHSAHTETWAYEHTRMAKFHNFLTKLILSYLLELPTVSLSTCWVLWWNQGYLFLVFLHLVVDWQTSPLTVSDFECPLCIRWVQLYAKITSGIIATSGVLSSHWLFNILFPEIIITIVLLSHSTVYLSIHVLLTLHNSVMYFKRIQYDADNMLIFFVCFCFLVLGPQAVLWSSYNTMWPHILQELYWEKSWP